MTSPIQGLISPTTGLFPALREIVGRSEQHDGILRIEDNNVITGDVALSQSRYITGAYESSTGMKGVQALTKLLAVRKGSFKFIPTSNGFDTNLQQTLKLDVKKLVSEEETEDTTDETSASATNGSANNPSKKPSPSPNTIAAPTTVKPEPAPKSAPSVKQEPSVKPDQFATNRSIMIPQFAADATVGNVDNTKQVSADTGDKTAVAAPNSMAKKPAAIHVSKTKADMDGQFVYADMEQDDDLYSLLEHFGLSVEQPIVERLYDTKQAPP